MILDLLTKITPKKEQYKSTATNDINLLDRIGLMPLLI